MARRKLSEQDLGKFIRSIGGDWKKFEDRRFCPHCHQMMYRVDNQPFDGMAVISGTAVPIEIKSAKLSFSFSDIKDHQRAGLDDWQEKHGRPTWLALQMGTQRIGALDTPRRFWLIMWNAWKGYEETIYELADLVSIPYDSNAARMRVAVQEHQLGAVQFLADWELQWREGEWQLSGDHPFFETYLRRSFSDRRKQMAT